MPRPKRRFLQMKVPTTVTPKQQCCVVCYSEFTPFTTTNDKWESNMIKMFYNVLDIPSMGASEDGDEEDSVISLPFCPQCHSKICIMSSLRTQLQQIQSQFSTVRDDVAFTIVDTIDRNCRNGPMDFIRQQIYDKWKTKFDDAKKKGDLDTSRGLERLAEDLPTGNLTLEELRPLKDNSKRSFNRMSRLEALPAPPLDHSSSNGVVAIPTNSRMDQLQMQQQQQQLQHQQLQQQQQPQPSKRPARAASLGYAQYLLYSQSTSRAKIRRMEALAIRESIKHEMPKLTPISSFLQLSPQHTPHQQQQQQQQQQQARPNNPHKGRGGPGTSKAAQQKLTAKNRAATAALTNSIPLDETQFDSPSVQGNRRGSSGKRSISTDFDNGSPVATKLPKVQTTKNILKSIRNEPPVQIKLKGGRKPKYQPDPPLHTSFDPSASPDIVSMQSVRRASLNDSGMDLMSNGLPPMKPKRRRRRTEESCLIGDFPCQLCPKSYMNISRLRRHESLCHPSTKSLQCSICPNGFSSMLAYRRHMQNQHHRSLKGTITMTCPFCKKSFVKQTAYDYHLRKHHERKDKRVRRTKAEMLSLKLEKAEQEAQKQLNPLDVDPLLITEEDHEDVNQNIEDADEYQGLDIVGESILPDAGPATEPVDDPMTSAVVKKVKKQKPNKIFGRKSRKRRAAGIVAAMKRRAGSMGVPDGNGEHAENSGVDVKLNSGNETSLGNVKTEKTPRRVGFKSRLSATPTPPVRKSLRRAAESHAPKGELKIHDPGHADEGAPYDDDKVVYNCSVCSMSFPNMDQLETHKMTHTQEDTCKECEEKFESSEELKAHILNVHPHSMPSTLATSKLLASTATSEEPEPEPIEINLEEPESVLPNLEKSNAPGPVPNESVTVAVAMENDSIPMTNDKILPVATAEILPTKKAEEFAKSPPLEVTLAVDSAAKAAIAKVDLPPKPSDDLSKPESLVPVVAAPILEKALGVSESPKKDLSSEKIRVIVSDPTPQVDSNGNGTHSESTEIARTEPITPTPVDEEPTPCYPSKIVDTVVSVT